jgi:hypothetical protein
MDRQKDLNGIGNTVCALGKTASNWIAYAITAASHTLRWLEQSSVASAQTLARLRRAGQAAKTTCKECALFVVQNLRLIGTRKPRHAEVRLVGKRRLADPKRVFDLTVEDQHSFYAAGILVSNCHDALQYASMETGGIQATKEKPKQPTRLLPRRPIDPGMGMLGF